MGRSPPLPHHPQRRRQRGTADAQYAGRSGLINIKRDDALLHYLTGHYLAVVAYVGLGAVLTTTGRSTSFGLGVAVGIILVELVAYPLADIGAELLGFSVNEYTRWTLGGATSGLVNGDGDLTRWVFLLAVLVYVVLLWGLTLVIMTRRDLSSGNG